MTHPKHVRGRAARLLCAVIAGACTLAPGCARVDIVPSERLASIGTIPEDLGEPAPTLDCPMGCGVQALVWAMRRTGSRVSPEELYERASFAQRWCERGATPLEIVAAARAAGFGAELRTGSVQDLLDRTNHADAEQHAEEPLLLLFRSSSGGPFHWAGFAGRTIGEQPLLVLTHDEEHFATVSPKAFESLWDDADRCVVAITPSEP